MAHRCPTCKARVDASKLADSPSFFPFCCERCKLIDLGAWLEARYRITTPADQANETGSEEQAVEPEASQKAKKTL